LRHIKRKKYSIKIWVLLRRVCQTWWNLNDFLFIIFSFCIEKFVYPLSLILPFIHSLIDRISTDSAHWLENLSHPSLLKLLNIHISWNFALVDCHSAFVLFNKNNYWTNKKLLNQIIHHDRRRKQQPLIHSSNRAFSNSLQNSSLQHPISEQYLLNHSIKEEEKWIGLQILWIVLVYDLQGCYIYHQL